MTSKLFVVLSLTLMVAAIALAPTLISYKTANAKEMTCDLNEVKTCSIIARHGDIEIDKLIIVNKVGGSSGGGTVDQQARDDITKLQKALDETNGNLNNVTGKVTALGNSTIDNLVIETQNPENTTGTGTNSTNSTGGGILPNGTITNGTG